MAATAVEAALAKVCAALWHYMWVSSPYYMCMMKEAIAHITLLPSNAALT